MRKINGKSSSWLDVQYRMAALISHLYDKTTNHKPNGHKGRSRTIDGICGPPASSPSHPSELASASGVGLAKPRMHRKNATPLLL
jgi:hypothetical protein